MGGPANIERQHKAGRLTVRERIDRLLDPGSFHEIGALAGQAKYDDHGNLATFIPSNFVAGAGRIDGRPVVVGGDDFTVRGGAADAAIGNKMGHAEKLARGMRMPMVRLVDGTGGGGSVKTIEQIGRTYVPANPAWDTITAILGEVPVIGACLGPVAGLGAVRVVTSHFSLMVRDTSQLFVAGPPVVERGVGEKVSKEDLGGHEIHARGSGAVDNEVETEEEAFQTIRRFLSYLPSSVWQRPPRASPHDDSGRREEELISIIPRERRRSYDVRRILKLIFDRDSFFEIGFYYGRPLVSGLARLDGYPVGVIANDPKQRRRAQCPGVRQDDPAGGYLRYVSHSSGELCGQSRISDRHRRREGRHDPGRCAGVGRGLSSHHAVDFDSDSTLLRSSRRGTRQCARPEFAIRVAFR